MATFVPIPVKELLAQAKQAAIQELKELGEAIEKTTPDLVQAYHDVTGSFEPQYDPLHARRSANVPDKVEYQYRTKDGSVKKSTRTNYNAKRVGSNPNFETKDAPFYRRAFKQREALHMGLNPRVKVSTKIDTRTLTLQVKIESDVYNNSGKINNLWYWRDRGTSGFTQENTSPFSTPQGRPVRIWEGTSRSGLPATRWSSRIAERYIKKLQEKYGTLIEVSVDIDSPVRWHKSPLYKKLK